MLRTRIKRLAAQHERASERLADVETSIARLGDEDILDLADIFKDMPETALNDIVRAEMTRRNISL
jgi:hypothetical protein